MKKFLVLIIFLLVPRLIMAQPLNSIYENISLVSFEKYLYSKDSAYHTSLRPYLITEMKKAFDYDSIKASYQIEKYQSKKGLNLLFNRNLIVLSKNDFGFNLDPLFDFGYSYDIKNDRSSWINMRGFLFEGYLGKNFAFSTSFYETQVKLPLWVDNYARARNTVPGQGGYKLTENNAFDFQNASGYFSWSPSKYFNFQFGHGKQFWGDGYRSMILSDLSYYHPYFMISTGFWKIKYVVLYSQFSHPSVTVHTNNDGSSVFAKKYSTMHYLSYAPGKRWNISLFEAVVWQNADSAYYRGFELSYLNPVIFFRPVEFNLGSYDNEVMGLNLRFTAARWISFYAQYVFDDMRTKDMLSNNGWAGNKYTIQAGVKTFDLFGIENLNIQTEFNLIRPYTYSHRALIQNYSNANEPLAHPAGANTKEAVVIGKYNYKRLYLNLKYVWEGTGLDSAGINYGKNIFRNWNEHPNEYGNYTGQGLYTTLNQLDISVSFLVNPATNMNMYIGATFRREENEVMDNRYTYFSFGFRTSLRNLYYDFY